MLELIVQTRDVQQGFKRTPHQSCSRAWWSPISRRVLRILHDLHAFKGRLERFAVRAPASMVAVRPASAAALASSAPTRSFADLAQVLALYPAVLSILAAAFRLHASAFCLLIVQLRRDGSVLHEISVTGTQCERCAVSDIADRC